MFKSKPKRKFIALTSGILAVSLAAGLFLLPGKQVAAAVRLYGVQKLVDQLATSTFTVLELVPDHSDDSLGYLVSGSEPVLAESIMRAATPVDGTLNYTNARRTVASTLYSKLSTGDASGTQALISFDASNFYTEQVNAPSDPTGWNLLDFSEEPRTELRTGYFAGYETIAGAESGDYYYRPELTFDICYMHPTEEQTYYADSALSSETEALTFYGTVKNTGERELTNLAVRVGVSGSALTVTGVPEEENTNITWNGTEAAIGTLAAGESVTLTFTVDLAAFTGETELHMESSLLCLNPTRQTVSKTYSSDGYKLLRTDSYIDLANVDRSTARQAAIDPDDYHLFRTESESAAETTEEETTGEETGEETPEVTPDPDYVWVDSADGTALQLEIPRLWYRTVVSSTNLFSTKILELEANASSLFKRIHVISCTPAELDEALAAGTVTLDSVDLLYISNSSVFGSLKCDNLRVSSLGSYSEENDLDGVIASMITEHALLYQMPVVVDWTLMNLSSELASGITTLVQDLYNYAESTSYSSAAASISSSRALIGENVCFHNDRACGNLAKGDLTQVFFTYKSTKDVDRGETTVAGLSQVIDEISNDNFYNEEGSFTSEYRVDNSDTEIISISRATLIKYILNFANHRIVLYKDSIKVLDLEPADSSELSEDMIRGWLGANSSSSALREIRIDQMSTEEFIGKLVDLIAEYDMIYIGAGAGTKPAVTNGKIYAHVGDAVDQGNYFTNGWDIKQQSATLFISEMHKSGNDITEDKYEDLLEYVEAGYPIVVDGILYKDGHLDTAKIDVDSLLYKFLDQVGHGYARTEKISVENYDALTDKTGYTRVEEYTFTNEMASITLERMAGYTSRLTDSYNYLIAVSNFNTANDQFKVLNGNGTLNASLTAVLAAAGKTAVTLDANDVPESLRWSISAYEDGNHDYLVKNSSGKYLNITESGVSLSDSLVITDITEGVNTQNSFFLSQNGTGYYLFSENNSLYTQFTMSPGDNARIFLYRITPGRDVITKSITKAEYEAAVGTYGSADAAEAHGYKCSVYYEKTFSNDTLPNVIQRTTDKTLTRLARYINMPRLNLVMISQPVEYSAQTDASGAILTNTVTWLQKKDGYYWLEYEFEFSNVAESIRKKVTYEASLFLDINADGQFREEEELDGLFVTEVSTNQEVDASELSSGVRYRLRRRLPDDYVGLLPWRLEVSINTTNVKENVRSVVTGYTAVKATQKTTIKVLQLVPKNCTLYLTGERSQEDSDTTGAEAQFKTMLESVKTLLNYDIQVQIFAVPDANKYPSNFANALESADMLVIGFADSFGRTGKWLKDLQTSNRDITSEAVRTAITNFIESGRSVMVTHDTTSMQIRENYTLLGGWSYNVNQFLRNQVGMDRYGYTISSLASILNVSQRGNRDTATRDWKESDLSADQIASIRALNKDIAISSDTFYADSIGFTDFALARTGSSVTGYDIGNDITTAAISQVNEGQLTLFPYNISDDAMSTRALNSAGVYQESVTTLPVATTHGQYYQLDYQYDKDSDGDNDLVVWYCLAESGTSSHDNYVHYYGSTVNDVRNNYYIYSVGNIIYTGLGHSGSISTVEMQLFINTMIAAANNGLKSPAVTVTNGNSKTAVLSDIYDTFDGDTALDTETDDFGFFVEDINIVNATKTIKIGYYYEIPKSEYSSTDSRCKTTLDSDGHLIYLRQFSDNSGASDYIGKVLKAVSAETGQETSTYYSSVENSRLCKVSVLSSWVAQQLSATAETGHGALSYTDEKDGTEVYVYPQRLWIGAWSVFNGNGHNNDTSGTGFSSVTFRKRSLLELD